MADERTQSEQPETGVIEEVTAPPEVTEEQVSGAVTAGASEAVEGAGADASGERPSPSAGPIDSGQLSDSFAEHPEYFVGGAFAAGLLLARILGRLGSDG